MGLYRLLKNKSKLVRKRARHRLSIFWKYYRHRAQKEPIFILTTRRTGSNLLLEYLNSVPGVSFAPEILNQSMFYGVRGRFITKRAVLRHIRHSVNACAQSLCGAKLIRIHLEKHRITPEDLRRLYPNARFIILYRRSLLEQFVSLRMAEASDRWQSTQMFEKPTQVKVDVLELKEFCRNTRQFYEGLWQRQWLKERAVYLSYEELALDAQSTFNERIFPFLGLAPSKVVSHLRKQNTQQLNKAVLNYQDIEPLVNESWLWYSIPGNALPMLLLKTA